LISGALIGQIKAPRKNFLNGRGATKQEFFMLVQSQKFSKVVLILSVFSAMLFGCASGVKQADIPSNADPGEEVQRLTEDLNRAVTENVDVLAVDDFEKSKKFLKKARSAVADGDSHEDTLDLLRTGRGYLEKAYTVAGGRGTVANSVMEARQRALETGIGSYPELAEELQDVDDDLSDQADKLAKTSAEDLSEYQRRYVDLERRSVLLTQLGNAGTALESARKDGAKRKAPESYKTAELSLNTAEAVVSTNVRNPEGYKEAVAKANYEANHLVDVMATLKQYGSGVDEAAAVNMVAQNRKIRGLTSDLGAVTATGAAAQSALKVKNQELAGVTTKVKLRDVLDKAREQFSDEEAEVYQQGDTLVVRLKQVNFASGRADIPASSIPLLAKVSDVAKSLKASEIVVEGHTDSTGTATINKSISEERASAVATYLKANGFGAIKVDAEGYGFEKPIATNKSKEGRAQNRRVDVIITPETTTR
jgi:outer membrane protein OmpA-like peptidoglycan-associated protein